MLVLTRRTGEEIVVTNDIRIRVVAIKGNRVQIGVHAPDSIRIDRLETHQERTRPTASASLLNLHA
jgi:carbon storage regulator